MSARDEVTARVLAACRAVAGDHRLPVDVQDAATEPASDVVDALQLGGRLLLLLSDAEDAAKSAGEALRDTILAVMVEEGAPSIRLPHHTMTAADGRTDAVITDAALIPPELMRQPPPAPDKAAVSARLRAGRPVPGAALRNGAPHLQLRARKERG